MTSDDSAETKQLIAIARTVIEAGVEQLQKADLSQDDPQVVVARIYIAMEIAAYMLEEELAATVYGERGPVDKSKLN